MVFMCLRSLMLMGVLMFMRMLVGVLMRIPMGVGMRVSVRMCR